MNCLKEIMEVGISTLIVGIKEMITTHPLFGKKNMQNMHFVPINLPYASLKLGLVCTD